MDADISSMSQEEKSAYAKGKLPDPRFETVGGTEGEILKKSRKSRKQKRRHRRTKKSLLKLRKIR
jgi:hypothetical protein